MLGVVNKKEKVRPAEFKGINAKPLEESIKKIERREEFSIITLEAKKGKVPSMFEYDGKKYLITELEMEKYKPKSKFYKLISKINKWIIKKKGVEFFIKLTKINSKLDILSAKLFILASSAGLAGFTAFLGGGVYFMYNGKSPHEYKEFITNLLPNISIGSELIVGSIMLLYSYRKIKETVDIFQRVMVSDVEEHLKERYPEKFSEWAEITGSFRKASDEERVANKGIEISLNLGLSFLGPFKGFIIPPIMAIAGAINNIKYEKRQLERIKKLEQELKGLKE